MLLCFFYLQINVFHIYGISKQMRETYQSFAEDFLLPVTL